MPGSLPSGREEAWTGVVCTLPPGLSAFTLGAAREGAACPQLGLPAQQLCNNNCIPFTVCVPSLQVACKDAGPLAYWC